MIDGTAFCYRAFYAIRALSTPDGRPTNAVYGFAAMLQALRDKERPDYLAVAFDVGKPTFRHKRFEAYKVQRKPMPDLLIQQIPVIKTLLRAHRIALFEQEGYEAEDVLATIARRIAGPQVQVLLVTGDKDALQLIDAHTKVYNPHKEETVLDAEAVRARYGVAPEQMVDLMALMGDKIDNIPSVPGIGEKTASQLLQRFGTLEQLYQSVDQLDSPAQRQSLEASREQVELSRELARIDRDVPLTVTLEDLKPQEPDWRALRTLYRELDFKRLLATVNEQDPVSTSSTVRVHLAAPSQLPSRSATSDVLCWPASGGVVVAISAGPEEAWVVRLDRAAMETASGQAVAAWLADASAHKISHDGKLAKRLLRSIGLELNGLTGDTMLAAYLLNPARSHESFNDVIEEQLEERLGSVPSLEADDVAAESILQLCGQQAAAVHRVHERLVGTLRQRELFSLYTDLELPLLSVLAEMEATGITIDLPYLAGLRATMDATLSQLKQEVFRLAECEFNLNSPKQLAQVLFERLKLPIIKRTKTGASTDSDVLHQLAERHPLPEKLLQYRELSKLVSTYVEALPALADPVTGRVHTSFNQTTTATGRLSSSDPNLQNIPIRTELGRSIRKAFIPGITDGVLLAADYSQIELRILAHLSGDPQLVEAFRQDRDIHRVTASSIYGIPEAEVQPEQRYAMKAVNFGILYGMSAHGLSKELSLSFEEAQTFIDAYFQRYPGVRAYLDQQIAQAKRDGFVQTLLGRRRYIPEINSPDLMIRQFGERMAVNAPVQGSAADLIKQAMIRLPERLRTARSGGRLLLQVHDELVLECPRGELSSVAALVRDTMEGAIALNVPLKVTTKAGPNWLELAPL